MTITTGMAASAAVAAVAAGRRTAYESTLRDPQGHQQLIDLRLHLHIAEWVGRLTDTSVLDAMDSFDGNHIDGRGTTRS